jgi:hypothetical protein
VGTGWKREWACETGELHRGPPAEDASGGQQGLQQPANSSKPQPPATIAPARFAFVGTIAPQSQPMPTRGWTVCGARTHGPENVTLGKIGTRAKEYEE